MTDTDTTATGSHLPFFCDDCGREFPTAAALGGHRSSAHRSSRNPRTKAKAPCPECGGMFVIGQGIGRHRMAAHGIPGKKGKTAIELAPHPVRVDPATDFGVDDIVIGTIGMLYLDGTVPIRKLPALLAWRDATRLMLEEIR